MLLNLLATNFNYVKSPARFEGAEIDKTPNLEQIIEPEIRYIRQEQIKPRPQPPCGKRLNADIFIRNH
jgi:hypothetical protein